MKRPFHVSLETVLEEPVAFEHELSFSAADLDREPLQDISPVRIQGAVSRIEHGFALEAELAYGGRLECSRCLTSYPFQTAERFSVLLYKRPPALEKEISLDRGDLDVLFYEDPEISLSPIAEERIQIAVPMKPLCREDCLGLCPNCGADRNTEECRCAPAPDPRWDALRLISRND